MTKKETLTVEYTALFGKAPDAEMTIAELQTEIEVKKATMIVPSKDDINDSIETIIPNTNEPIEELISNAEDAVFATHPKLDVYFKTTDGTPFFTDAAAKNHAKSLEDKKVEKITKG